MKERPIIFRADMVRAILAGKKTQTRRLIKVPKGAYSFEVSKNVVTGERSVYPIDEDEGHLDKYCLGMPCPYGDFEDQLWVREAFSIEPATAWHDLPKTPHPLRVGMAAYYKQGFIKAGDIQWRTPIFMPRWASRITLEITEVSIKQIQETTEEDAEAEGFEGLETYCAIPGEPHLLQLDSYVTPLECFKREWDLMHAKTGNSWEANPWVWAITFNRI